MAFHKYFKLILIVLSSFLVGWYSHYFADNSTITSHNIQLNEMSKKNNKLSKPQIAKVAYSTALKPILILSSEQSMETNNTIDSNIVHSLSKLVSEEDKRVLLPSTTLNNEPLNQIDYQSNVLYSSENIQDRLASIDILTNFLASEKVAIGLGDNDPTVRIKAIEGLKQIATDNAIRYIGQSLYTTNTLETKLAAINALSELSYHPNANQFLRYSSQKDENKIIRTASLKALGEYSIDN